jgi:predicted secreted protein
MTWFNGAVLYLLIWWVSLFAVLPLGVRPMADPNPETGWRGTPQAPRLWQKALITTLVAGVVWGLLFWIISSDWLSFRSGWLALPEN